MEDLKKYKELKTSSTGKKRLHIDVDSQHYDRIKVAAINRGMTITRYVMSCVLPQVLIDEKYR